MINLIIKKEITENWQSIKKNYRFKHKFIMFRLVKWYYKSKGYEVEELED